MAIIKVNERFIINSVSLHGLKNKYWLKLDAISIDKTLQSQF